MGDSHQLYINVQLQLATLPLPLKQINKGNLIDCFPRNPNLCLQASCACRLHCYIEFALLITSCTQPKISSPKSTFIKMNCLYFTSLQSELKNYEQPKGISMVCATHSLTKKVYSIEVTFWYLKNISSVVQSSPGGLE